MPYQEIFVFIFYAAYFVFAVFLAFFIPGHVLLRKVKLHTSVKISLSLAVGLSMWALQGFIFALFSLRNLTYVYIIIFFILWVKYNKLKLPRIKLKLDREDKILLTIFTLGISLQIFSVVANAIPVREGLYFCCGLPDSLYHAALTNELIRNFPPNEPGIANLALKNYHLLSNLVIADIIRIFKLPLINTEFHFFPIFMSLLLGLSTYSFATILNLSKKFTIYFLLFIFFFSDSLFLLTLLSGHKIDFNISTIEVAFSLWISFSRYFGVVLFFTAISLLQLWKRNNNFLYAFLFVLVSATLIGFKVYIGIFILAGSGFLFLYYLFKKDLKSCLVFVSLAILSLLIYLPVNKGAGGLMFSGFWRAEDFIVQPAFGLSNMELARKIYLSAGNVIKVYLYDLTFLLIYFVFSLGGLIIAFFNSLKSLKRIDFPIHIFLLSGLAITTILGMFFLQKTGGANSSQFLISAYLVLPIYASLTLYSITNHKKITILLLLIIFSSFLPKTLYLTSTQIDKLVDKRGTILTRDTTSAFSFISKATQENSVFVVDPQLGDTCIFLPIFTNRQPYTCSSGAPGDRGVDLRQREENVERILASNYSPIDLVERLKVKYIILPSRSKEPGGFDMIYQNPSIKVLKLKQ